MKKFSLYTLFLCLGMLTIVSCSEKERAFPEFQDLEQGAYPRLVEGVFGDLDYEHWDNADSSSLSFTVEFYDNNNGQNVTEYSWSVAYGSLFGPAVVKTYTPSDFTTNSDGLPQLSATITFAEVFAALGMTIDDFLLTTDFQLDATLKTSQGQEFTFVNTGSNVVGQPTFQALFRYVPLVTKKPCNSVLAGEFDAATKSTNQMAGIGWDDCDGNTWDGPVRWEATHDPSTFDKGIYNIYSTDATNGVEFDDSSMGAYYSCYGTTAQGSTPNGDGAGNVQLTESCGKMEWQGASQWGEVFSLVKVAPDGATLTIGWTNDYGEGGESELTRTDGNAWQNDLFCDGC